MIEKDSPEHKMIKGKKIMVIDELDDTRYTLQYITDLLLDLGPKEIGVGVLHNKSKEKKGKLDKSIKYFSGKTIQTNGLYIHGRVQILINTINYVNKVNTWIVIN